MGSTRTRLWVNLVLLISGIVVGIMLGRGGVLRCSSPPAAPSSRAVGQPPPSIRVDYAIVEGFKDGALDTVVSAREMVAKEGHPTVFVHPIVYQISGNVLTVIEGDQGECLPGSTNGLNMKVTGHTRVRRYRRNVADEKRKLAEDVSHLEKLVRRGNERK